ncbi:MAG: hypothetical protein L6V87_01985 [Ruminococcus sp.]|nr:MAG: hypothetical protein L6V87_01985 [Ruminococcus sp.]
MINYGRNGKSWASISALTFPLRKNPANGNFFNSGTPCVAVLQGNLKYTSEVSLGNNVGNVRRIENLAGIQINQKIQQLSANLDKAKK